MACKTKCAKKIEVQRIWTDIDGAIDDNLKSIVSVHRGLVILEGCRAILRRDYDNMPGKVKLISGGGSGNEPSHVGFVGPGMLTAAVVGHFSAAPPSEIIFNVIEELGSDHAPGILLIVQNYTGYRVNFGLAKLKAQKKGIIVEMITVEDDVSVEHYANTAEKRGLAGTLFIHKIAGAMAEAGEKLNDIYNLCNRIAKDGRLATIGVCIKPSVPVGECICYGQVPHKIELGCGIQGEPGVSYIDFMPAEYLANTLINSLVHSSENLVDNNKKNFCKGTEVAVIVNNLGGCSQVECNIFTLHVLEQLKLIGVKVQRTYMGSLMTLLDTIGFHVSLLNLSYDERLVNYLDAFTAVPAWPKLLSAEIVGFEGNKLQPVISRKFGENVQEEPQGPIFEERLAKVFLIIVIFACDALIACSEQLNIMDKDSGDGDCGSRLACGANAVKAAIKENKIVGTRPSMAFTQLSQIIDKEMGGLQGGMYSVFLEAIAKTFAKYSSSTEVTADMWLTAFIEGNNMISEIGKVSIGDRTMLDSLVAAQHAFANGLSNKNNPIYAFGEAVKAAEKTAKSTINMPALRGQASLIKCKSFSYPDPGAHAVGIWMRAVYEGIKLKLSCYDKT